MNSPIVVVDFGGQYAHLIANRIRRLGAYSEIISNDISKEELLTKNPAGIIFSGGPHSVYDLDAPMVKKWMTELNIPVLGICYGHQVIAKILGGEVEGSPVHEFGKSELKILEEKGIFENISQNSVMWMSHGDHVTKVPEGFCIAGTTKDCSVAAMAHFKKNIYGIQFHPEVTHSEKGMELLKNFIRICGVENTWNIGDVIEQITVEIQQKCKGKKVFLLVSGGVDSSVCFALLSKALGKDRVFGCLIDHGMMRENEASEVKMILEKAGFPNLHIENAADQFLKTLEGVTVPEEKRKAIGNMFLEVQAYVSKNLNLNPNEWILGQGTIYPDTIESGGTKHSSKIKTHHNRVDAIQRMIDAGTIVEPVADLYKDEVREVGRRLGLSEDLIGRHPFPGPGLGVRILCATKADPLENATEKEEKIMKTYPNVKAIALPIRSVGVQGDGRSYRHPVVLEFLEETPFEKKLQIATDISNAEPSLNRVLWKVMGNLESKFSVSPSFMTKERIAILQHVDGIVREEISKDDSCNHIWQFPVVLAPVFQDGKEAIILRPIESENAMTATAAEIPEKLLKNIISRIQKEVPNIVNVFYDLTGKPPGTIEWE